MQPYFFPYPGYFALIKRVDVFILDDLAQYTPKGWMNRNRLRRPGGGWQYVTLPVRRHPANARICEIELADQPWRDALWGKLSAYARAPQYAAVCRWLRPLLETEYHTLAQFSHASLQAVCDVLTIQTPICLLSRLRLPGYCPPYPKGENALAVCCALGSVAEYRNLPGGAAFYPRQPYRAAGIRLRFQQWQGGEEPPLSILDALLRYPPQEVTAQLDAVCLFE